MSFDKLESLLARNPPRGACHGLHHASSITRRNGSPRAQGVPGEGEGVHAAAEKNWPASVVRCRGEKVDKPYTFEGPEGKLTLADLFAGRRPVIIQHFLFGPEWDEGCPGLFVLVRQFQRHRRTLGCARCGLRRGLPRVTGEARGLQEAPWVGPSFRICPRRRAAISISIFGVSFAQDGTAHGFQYGSEQFDGEEKPA